MTRLLIRSFLLRALLPHALAFAALVARDLLLWPDDAASAAPYQRTAPELLAVQRGLFSAAALALSWGSCLTLCGFFRGAGRTPPEGGGEAAPAPGGPPPERTARYGWALPVGLVAGLVLVIVLGCLPGYRAGLWNLGAALASALWLFRRYSAAVLPGLRPAWEEALRQEEKRAAREAERGEILRKIAGVDAELARLRDSPVGEQLIGNQSGQLARLRREYERQLQELDTRGVEPC